VQEALTNARRHAGTDAKTALDVTIDGGAVSILVTDDGGGRSPVRLTDAAGGFGLLGMRERVESTGGALVARPRERGGWEVRAEWNGRTP
jgi:signal transduction histidine kinase